MILLRFCNLVNYFFHKIHARACKALDSSRVRNKRAAPLQEAKRCKPIIKAQGLADGGKGRKGLPPFGSPPRLHSSIFLLIPSAFGCTIFKGGFAISFSRAGWQMIAF